MKKDKAKRNTAIMALILLLAAVSIGSSIYSTLLPTLRRLGSDAALLAAAAAMPEGTLSLLEQQFSGYLEQKEAPAEPSSISEPEPQPAQPNEEPSSQTTVQPAPEIEKQYRGTLVAETMYGSESAVCYSIGSGFLRNYTSFSKERILSELAKPLKFAPKADGTIEVLIMHTHATESYEPYDAEFYDTRNDWRSTDNGKNMVAVGNVIEEQLKAAGIGVVHDTTQFDYPSYNGSYDRAAETIEEYLKKYPDIQLILDVHRDGIQRDETTIVKPYTVIDGKKAAQVMILCGSDIDGTLGMPNWSDNLRMAAAVTNAVESAVPSLMRPIFFSGNRYNMDLCGGTILLEIGSQANTLEEAMYSAQLLGSALAEYILEQKEANA